MTTDRPNEEVLLSRVAGGDRAAMKALYERYSDAVYRFAKVWLADPFEAADVMHETMLDVWRTAGRFAGRSSVKSWIFAIARNKAVDRNRKSARVSPGEPDPETPDEGPEPSEVFALAQSAARVRVCIETLSPAHRAVIQMAFFDDLTYAEIAEIENCPVGTVKTRVMHAKQHLLRCLQKSGGR